jgi:GAF domain-containing protein
MTGSTKDIFYLTDRHTIQSQSSKSQMPTQATSKGHIRAEARASTPNQSQISGRNNGATPGKTVNPDKKKQAGQDVRPNSDNCDLGEHMNRLAELIANVTEAYSVSIFVLDDNAASLSIAGSHSLSRDFLHDVKIGVGSGLVGWTAENAVRISVCPFERDASTLLYYGSDQDLKSFIALPILDEDQVLGVIAVDSKKSYAFAKITEKILSDCAGQAAALIRLIKLSTTVPNVGTQALLPRITEKLFRFEDEGKLLEYVASLPTSVIQRDALVVMTTAEGGVGSGTFYSSSKTDMVGNRLIDLVCKHKKVICADRVVLSAPNNDSKQRSFLSIPFHSEGAEAGSLNVLSQPYKAFQADEIESLEKIAQATGLTLERIRLKERCKASDNTARGLSWKHFAIRARARLAENSNHNVGRSNRGSLTLLRVSFTGGALLEEHFGPEVAIAANKKVLRLIQQLCRHPSLSCALYDSQVVILAEKAEAEQIRTRILRLLERMGAEEFGIESANIPANLGQLIRSAVFIASDEAINGRSDLETLMARTRALLDAAKHNDNTILNLDAQTKNAKIDTTSAMKEVANAGNW